MVQGEKIALQIAVVGIVIFALSLGSMQWNKHKKTATPQDTPSLVFTAATQTYQGATQEKNNTIFIPCPMSQGMLIGKQPLFVYQEAGRINGQLQAVKVAAGLIYSQPICKYYNSQAKGLFTIVLPGSLDSTQCHVENSMRVGFLCKQ